MIGVDGVAAADIVEDGAGEGDVGRIGRAEGPIPVGTVRRDQQDAPPRCGAGDAIVADDEAALPPPAVEMQQDGERGLTVPPLGFEDVIGAVADLARGCAGAGVRLGVRRRRQRVSRAFIALILRGGGVVSIHGWVRNAQGPAEAEPWDGDNI